MRLACTHIIVLVARLAFGLVALTACGRKGAEAREGGSELRLVTPEGHSAPVFSAGYSPDGRLVVTASDDGTARIWEASTGREIRRLESAQRDTAWIRSAAFSADGRTILTGSLDRTARLWDAVTGRELRRLSGHTGGITSVAFSRDGRLVLTASHDGSARLWNPESGAVVRTLAGHTDSLTSAALSSDGRLAVTASRDGTVRIWETGSGRLVRSIGVGAGRVSSAAFSPDGRRIVTASQDSIARVWIVADGTEQVREGARMRHPMWVTAATFSPDGRTIVTGSDDGVARIWDATTFELMREIGLGSAERHVAPLRAVAFSPDGASIVTASLDRTAKVWSSATGRLSRSLTGHARSANSLSFSPDGLLIVSASDDSSARIWEVATGREVLRPGGHSGPVQSAAFSPDGRFVATASLADPIRVWNATTGSVVHERIRHEELVRGVAFSADGRLLLTASPDGTARIWDAASAREIHDLLGHTGPVNAASFSPDGRFVLTASYDTTVRLWDAATGKQLRALERQPDMSWAAAFSPDGGLIVTASRDRVARIFDAATGRRVRDLAGHAADVTAAVFSPDGLQVLTGSQDRTAILWDARTGRRVRRLEGHAGWVVSTAFSPDGKFLATTSRDGTTRVWDAENGTELFRRFALDSTDWVAVAPDGRFDGSEGGMRRLHYARGLKTVSLESFFDRFYTPGLTGLLMAHAPYDGPDIRKGYEPPPAVRIASPLSGDSKEKRVTVVIEAKDDGGGLEDVRLYHNGALVAQGLSSDRTGVRALAKSAEYCPAGSVCMSHDLELLAGMNTVEATAFASDRTEAERSRITLVAEGADSIALHVLAVGINSYKNPAYNLSYGRDDANALAAALRSGGAEIFRGGISIDTLFDANATRANIAAAFARIAARSKPKDVFVFFYAGHGTTDKIGGETKFFLVPTDVERATDAAQLARYGISGEQLRALFEAIPALKKMMVVDACQSGAVVAGYTRRGAAEERAIAQLARSSGLFVMSSTDSEQFAREVNVLGHGILTSALLGALEGIGEDTSRIRTVRQVMGSAERLTRELAIRHGSEAQYPLMHSNGMDFPIVVVQPGRGPTLADSRQGPTLDARRGAAGTPPASCGCALP